MRTAVIADYASKEDLLNAYAALKSSGLTHIEVYSPFGLEELSEINTAVRIPLARAGWIGAVIGGFGGYGMQWYLSAVYYPLKVAGRPFHSPIAFIPVTFECAILFASLAVVGSFFFQCGLPEPYHPIFEWSRFNLARIDGFFLSVDVERESRQLEEVRSRILMTSPQEISVVRGDE